MFSGVCRSETFENWLRKKKGRLNKTEEIRDDHRNRDNLKN